MTNSSAFTFAKGNAQKLVSLPIYALGKLASLIVPRSANLWVFGSGAGIAEGALALYREVRHTQPEITPVWLVSSQRQRDDALAHKIPWAERSSWRGFWLTLRASTIVVTHGFGDVNRFGVFGGFVVQLWHGIPLKKLHLDTEVTVKTQRGFSSLLTGMYRAGGNAITLFVVSSEAVGERIRTAFGVRRSAIAPIGDPRDDELVHADPLRSRETVLDMINLSATDATLVLFAPTWRDGDIDPAVPSESQWQALNTWAESVDAHLIVRSHPLGVGAYEHGISDRIHLLTAEQCPDITPLLKAFDVLITDYSSIAFDYSLTGKPILWFAPDLQQYEASRGLYEPYASVTEGEFADTWDDVVTGLNSLGTDPAAAGAARARTARLAERLFAFRDGKASRRVLDEILARRDHNAIAANGANVRSSTTVYFESFYGRQVSCNPLAIDAQIARVAPDARRFWAVESVLTDVPEGAIRVLVGTPQARNVRAQADIVVVNDWLRKDFRPTQRQTVIQTWHGTMLKKLALERPHVSLRTRLATLRESRKWSVLLSQNEHCTKHLRSSYGYHGPIWQVGYPRNDELVRLTRSAAKKRLGIKSNMRVLAYAPTWRDGQHGLVDLLDVADFAKRLPDDWVLLVRGHTRTHEFGGYPELKHKLIDVSSWPNVNEVIAASDLFVTDYSSLMFDVSVAEIPMAFYVPDLQQYRDRERGFTFDFEQDAPAPLLTTPEQLLATVENLATVRAEFAKKYAAWRKRFNPHDDGAAAERVVQRLLDDGTLVTATRPS